MTGLLTSDKDMKWHLEEIKKHASEIEELWMRGDEKYKGEKTCKEHAKTEAYDLIVLVAEAFTLPGIIERVPEEIKERFNKKRSKQ